MESLELQDQGQDAEAQNQALIEHEQDFQLQTSAETHNLAGDLDESLQQKIATQVIDTVRLDLESRAEWEEMQALWTKLYLQTDYEAIVGSQNWTASESIPLLTEACNMFATRTYKAFFTNSVFVAGKPSQYIKGQDMGQAQDRADRVARHINWQLTIQDPDYTENKGVMFLGSSIAGSYFTKAFFCPLRRRNVIDNIRAVDFAVPYTVGPINLEAVPRMTHILRVNLKDGVDLHNSGYFIDSPEYATDLKLSATDQAFDESEGLSQPQQQKNDNSGLALLYEQHLYFDLNDDGNVRPYIATVDATSRRLLRLSVNYESSPTGEPLDNYRRIEYFTHYRFMPNPNGFYGFGLGHLLGDINSACNVMLRQMMDAATLQNDGNCSGFVTDDIAIDGDDVVMEIGKFRKVASAGADIRSRMTTMQFAGPSDALGKLMEMLDQRGQRLGGVTEATTGASDKVQQPTTVITQVEQAMQIFTSIQLSLAKALNKELAKIYRLNSKYAPFVDYIIVNGTPEEVMRADYADDAMVELVFDPRFASQAQRIALAQAEMQAVQTNPVTAQNPQMLAMATRNYLQAIGSDRADEYFPEPPPPQNINDQTVENGYFLMPAGQRPPFDVFPDQDHLHHLLVLQQFMVSPAFAEIAHTDPQTAQAVMDHKRKHMSMAYMQENRAMPSQQQPLAGPPQMPGGQPPLSQPMQTPQMQPNLQMLMGGGLPSA